MRTWIIPLAIMMVVPALGAAAPIVQPPEPETLVEGHTVFTVIEQVNQIAIAEEEFAAAVAVLVRDVTREAVQFRFPGVLWFNDQYLVNPVNEYAANEDFRFPCTGAVLAVNAGAGDPVAAFAAATPVYNESYTITDPNDHVWMVDKFLDPAIGPIWAVAILGKDDVSRSTADDGTSNCAPYHEGETTIPLCPTDPSDPQGRQTELTPLRCAQAPDAGNDAQQAYIAHNGNALSYNAVLFMFLDDAGSGETDDLHIAGATKDHTDGSADRTNDVTGCHPTDPAFPERWPCPAGDDNREGNSHAYNPFGPVPGATDEFGQDVGVCPNCAGAYNHGGSDGLPMYQHATRNADIYYATAPIVLLRNIVLVDTEGSTAPFHCHEFGMAPDGVPSWNDVFGEPMADGCIDAIQPTEDDSVPEPLTESDPYYTGRY